MYRRKTLMLLEIATLEFFSCWWNIIACFHRGIENERFLLARSFKRKKDDAAHFLVDIDFVDENIHIYANIHCLSLNLLCKSRQVQSPIYILDEKFCEVVSGAWEEWLGNNCQKWSICFSKRSLFLEETPLCLDFNQTFQKFLPHSRCEWKAG